MATVDSAPILVDTREPDAYANTLRVRASAQGIQTFNTALPEGDYLWDREDGARVVVERKTLSDLAASVLDGRWADQIGRLCAYEVPVILIEGNSIGRFPKESAWDLDRLDAVLFRAQCAGLLVARSALGQEAVAARLLSLYRQTRDDAFGSLLPPRKPVFAWDPEEASVLGILTSLPGCGEKTARKLLDCYGSAVAVFAALKTQDPPPGVRTAHWRYWKEILTWRRMSDAA